MYPKNAASPPRIAIGAVVQISDGAVQSSGVSVAVRPEGGSESAGGGTTSYGGSSNVVYYVPTQAETNYTAFVVTAYKTGCIPVSVTVITTESAVAGRVYVETVATDAIDANALKADAVTKIQNGLATSSSITGLGTRLPAALTADGMMKSDTLYINGTGQSNGDINLKIDAVKSDTAAIKLVADEITFTVDGAVDVNIVAWLGYVATVDGNNYPFIGSVNTKTGYALTSAYDPAKTAAQADTALNNTVWTDAKAALLDAPVSSASAPTPAAIADAVCDELLADHMIAGSLARGVASAGAAGDPLSNAVPGSYPEGTAGFVLGEVAAVRVLGPLNSVVPTVGGIRAGTTIVAYHYAPVEVGPISVFDDDGEPLNMSSYATDLAFIVFSWDGVTETLIHQLNYPNVTVGGDGNNQISLANTTPMTATAGRFLYGIRRRTSNVKVVRAEGEFIVKPMANVT